MSLDVVPTMPNVLRRGADLFGDADAVVTDDGRLSFKQLDEQVTRAAAAFVAAGVQHGDRIGIWAPNSTEWIVAALGAQALGAAIVPINTRLKGREAAYILRRSGARILVTVDEFLGTRYPQLLDGEVLPALERTVLLNGPASTDSQVSWIDFIQSGPQDTFVGSASSCGRAGPDDVCDIMFTSGTTGQPKGVMSSHAQNVRVFDAWRSFVGLQRGDRYLIVNPFFHTFGYKAGWLACLITGATIYPVATFDVEATLARIARDRITVLPGPPSIYQSILSSETRTAHDLSSLRLAVTGAASVPPALVRRMREEIGFRTVVTAYGLTESTGVVTICPPGTSDERVATRCGVAIPGVEVACVDEQGLPVADGDPGEVIVRGYNVMRGYFEDPVATAQAVDAEGWLHTGDIGILDADGFLRITDRKKDLFIVGGFNCYPAEIERILCEHPAVAQCAVIGVPDERLGEVGKAFLVLRPGATVSSDEMIAWSRANMANYKVPRFVEFVSMLPVNAAGKVQKFHLREGHTG